MAATTRLTNPSSKRRRSEGFSLLEVLVAMAIVAIAVFPMLQLTQEAEKAAFDAKFTSLACNRIRTLLSHITAVGRPGDEAEGDLSDLSDEEGYDERFAYTNIFYEWSVKAVDLSVDVTNYDSEEEDEEERDTIRDANEDESIDDRFRARYVRVVMFYQLENGDERELIVETYIPPLPRKSDSRIQDSVPPNRG